MAHVTIEAIDYEIGDQLVHPKYGPGEITDFRTSAHSGDERQYICIQLNDMHEHTLMLPVDRLDKLEIRPAISQKMIHEVMDGAPEPLDDDYRARHAHIKAVLKGGHPRQLLLMLRDLSWREKHQDLTTTDQRLQQSIRRRIVRELALQSSETLIDTRHTLQELIDQSLTQFEPQSDVVQ